MKPYLAIIKDSFREALASRALWVLLILITVFLLGLTPFHWQTVPASKLSPGDFFNIRDLAQQLRLGGRDDASKRSQYIWNSLSERTRERLTELKTSFGRDARRTKERLAENLNELIEREDFFDTALWADVKLDERAEPLLEQKELSQDLRQQLNRLALEAALPSQIRRCPDDAVRFRYAKWDLTFVGTQDRKLAQQILDQFVMAFMSIFVGFFGIFSGVIVTASIIPNMFDSGSLYVLLSKPVSRPLLFIAKYIGGCSFVLINAVYLILGLWLIANWRFGIFKPQLLWSIPIFVFSFAIFYAVSAISGLIWRSTVMAIVATVVFWFACTLVTTTKGLMEQFVVAPQRIRFVVRAEGELFVVRRNGNIARWDTDTGTLQDVMAKTEPPKGPPMMALGRSAVEGVVYDATGQKLVVLDRDWPQQNIVVGKKGDDWTRHVIAPAPPDTKGLYLHDGVPIAVSDDGVFQVSTVSSEEASPPEINLFGFKIPTPAPKETHTPLSEGITSSLPSNARIAHDPSTGSFFVWGAGAMRRWQVGDDGLFRETQRSELELDDVVAIAAAQGKVVVATQDESTTLLCYDDDSLEVLCEHHLDTDAELREITMSDNGRWVATLHENDRAHLIELDSGKLVKRLPHQGRITHLAFSGDNLIIADVHDRVLLASVPDMKPHVKIHPNQPWLQKLYWYVVKPLHVVFPKPSELEHTMTYAITGKQTMKVDGPPSASPTLIKLNPWLPLLSNSAFIVAMLLLGCVYIYRQDF